MNPGDICDMFWNAEIEKADYKEIQSIQLKRLAGALRAASGTPYYKKSFEENSIDISKITSLGHLKDLPFTSKQDLRLSYPDGMVALPREELVRLHASSGTTGKPTVIFYSKNDIDEWAHQVARGMVATGTTKKDVFQNMMGYGLFTGGLGLHYGAEKLGCLVIPSASGNTLRQIQFFQDFNTTVIT
jgi:phenylacetate-CoA ligase